MNSRERFNALISGREQDRPLIDYLAHPITDGKLRKYYNAANERQLLDALGCDLYYLSCRDISQNESSVPFYRGPKLEFTQTERVCPLGIRYRRGAFNSKFAVDEAITGPLRSAASVKDVLAHNWPKADWFDFSPMLGECADNKDRVITGGMWTGILGDSYRMFGFENFLLGMAMSPDIVRALVDRMTELYLELNDSIFSLLKGKLDIWFFGNDFGSQESLLFSESMFCDFFLENIKKLTALAHGYGIKVMMHSCGAITEIIPHLIEAGVDILDPIQVTARGMDIDALKRDFGGRIIFHGGIDTQQILPYGTAGDVESHCIRTLKTLGSDCGYIFAPSQILQAGIPVENIDIMYKTARQWKQGR